MNDCAVDSDGSRQVVWPKYCVKGAENSYFITGGIYSGQLRDYQLFKDSAPCRNVFNYNVNSDPYECRLVNPYPSGSCVF